MNGLTVVIPMHNGARWIASLISSMSSAAIEANAPLEILIFDDNSTDDSSARGIKVCQDLQLDFTVTRWDSANNAGNSSAAYMKALNSISPKYDLIALSDQDDLWLPNRILRISEAFNGESNDSIHPWLYAGSSFLWDSMKSNSMPYRSRPGPLGTSHVRGPELDYRKTNFDVSVSTHNIVINRALLALLKSNPLSDFQIRHDVQMDCWLPNLASHFGKTAVDLIPSVIWRQHSTNSSGLYLQSRVRPDLIRFVIHLLKRMRSTAYMKKYLVAGEALNNKHEAFVSQNARNLNASSNLWQLSSLESRKTRRRLALSNTWKHWSIIRDFYLRSRLILMGNSMALRIQSELLKVEEN